MEQVGRELFVMAAAVVKALLLCHDDDCNTVAAGCCFGVWLEDLPPLPPPKGVFGLDVATLLKCAIILLQFGLFLSICFEFV